MRRSKPRAQTCIDADIELIGVDATRRKRDALANIEAADALEAENDPRRPGVFNSGDLVVYSARFLQSVNCSLDIAKVFVIRECSCELCSRGDYVCTTEWLADYDTFWHVSRSTIRHKHALHVDDLPAGAQPPIKIPRVANTRSVHRD